LWNEFLESFDCLDELFVVETFNAGDKFDETYNSSNFAKEITKKGVKATYINGTMEVAGKKIAPQLKQGDIVLTLGAGDITKIGEVLNGLLAN